MSIFRKFSIDLGGETNNYSVTFTAPKRACKSLREELQYAVTHKANATTKPICVMVSGGVDSQSLLHTMRDMKIPFKAVHLAPKYNGQFIAERDIEQSQIFAKRHNFHIEYHELDIVLNRYPYMPAMNLLRYQTPYLATHSLIGLGGNNFHYYHNGIEYFSARSYVHNETPYWILDEEGYDLDLGFYQYTAELYFSFLFHPMTKRNLAFLKHNPHLPQSSSRLLKFNILYDEFGDELIYFQKRTGLEDFPKDVVEYDDVIWRTTGYDSWVTFTEEDLRNLYTGKMNSITKTSTVNPIVLPYLMPPKELLRI